MRRFWSYLCSSVFICGCLVLSACDGKPDVHGKPAPVVIYTSVDEPIARTVLKVFTEKTGIPVEARYDTEATKSVGLAERLRGEKANPQADVWWGNEIFLTINLAKDGCFAPYESPNAADVPAKFKDAEKRWASNGMRVRVIAVPGESDKSYKVEGLQDLLKPELKGKITMARPVAGTTTGHVSALYTLWGEAKADAYFKGLHANGIKLVGGNSMVVDGVKSRQFLAGLTDNDDVDVIGGCAAVLPDQKDIGTLAIPCTVALVAGRPQSESAKKLADYLLSKDIEQKLIDAKFVKYSVRAGAGEIKTMDVDYNKVAEIFPQGTRRATALLEGREP
jgi:iron(III) transport system substrate-binding protein